MELFLSNKLSDVVPASHGKSSPLIRPSVGQ